MAQTKIHIIGVGDDGREGLTQVAREILEQADRIFGSSQALSAIPAGSAQRHQTSGDLQALVEEIERFPQDRLVILTTGDPLFYGVARFLCEKLGKDRFEVVPHVSVMQMAFARVKESWEEAYLANLASVSLERVIEKIRTSQKAGLFTSDTISPADLAQELINHRIDYFTGYVCENLGSPDERVTQGDLADLAAQEFSALNVLILVRKPDLPDRARDASGMRLFGNPDELFLQSQPKRGLLTTAEVRSVALALLDLRPDSIVWDVGAGSGSVSIEAARIARLGTVYAIEMDPQDHQLIQQNAERLATPNVVASLGRAPDAWRDLPKPDAIFIGGTGRAVREIACLAFDELKPQGSLVVNVGSIGNLSSVQSSLAEVAGDVEVRLISISEATNQLDSVRFEARNPTFLISCIKHLAK